MLIAAARKLLSRLRQERGFTLPEVLMVMVAGAVVMGGITTILQVTLHETSRTYTKMDATGRGRSALARIENELHSACVADNETPIQGGANGTQDSGANDLVFLSQYGTAANPTPVEHRVSFSATNHTLTEYTYNSTGGSAPNWTFSTTPASTTVLLTNVSATPGSGGSIPVFQYFAYEPYTDVNGNLDEMLMDGSSSVPGTSGVPNPDPLSTNPGLSSTDAASTAEVLINFTVGAHGGAHENTNLKDTSNSLTQGVVFRFTPSPDTVGANNTLGPCE